MNKKVSFNAIATLITSLTDEGQRALVNNMEKLQEFVDSLIREDMENTFFAHIADKDAPAHLADVVERWRKLASDRGYTGPVLWLVKAGFTLKSNTPLAGPCYERLKYLQDSELQNYEPTTDSLAFFIPRHIATFKDVEEQKQALAEIRREYGLPEHHLSNFGSVALIVGLILAHFKRTGERTPLKAVWVRTDTLCADGYGLGLGGFNEAGLDGDSHCWDGDQSWDLGVFPLGVEAIGS